MKRPLRALGVLATSAMLAALGSQAAFADTVVTDGDEVAASGWGERLNLGDVCQGATKSSTDAGKTVSLAIERNGPRTGQNAYNNTFVNGALVTMAVNNATTTTGLSSTEPADITLPGNWLTLANDTRSDAVNPVVTLVAGTALGVKSGAVGYSASGKEELSGNTITRQGTLGVDWNVIECSGPVDTTAPDLSLPSDITNVEATSSAGAVVTYTASANDAVDGSVPVTCVPASDSTFALGTTTVNCSATDAHDNTANGSFTVEVVDTTAPDLSLPSNITGVEATSASGAAVNFSASATDIVDGSVPVSCVPASDSTFALGTTTVNCSATDAHDNTASGSFTVEVVDTTPPVITWIGGPQADASYVFGSVPAAGSCTAVDVVDGEVACAITGYSAAVGNHTLEAKATDSNDNTSTETRKYTVTAWTLTGFSQPVDMRGVFNVVKGGSTVPLKFEVFAGATELTDTGAVKSFTQALIGCDATAPLDDVEVTTTGGTSLRYDGTGGQFIQNWKTPTGAGKCYRVTMTTQDLSTIVAYFKLK